MKEDTNIYMISGLGADERAFQYLDLDFTTRIKHVKWIAPIKNEKLESYAKRIIESSHIRENSIVIGMSFGGIIAVEISKQVNLSKVILISSARNKKDLPFSYKILGKLGLTGLIPKKSLGQINRFVIHAFGVNSEKEKELLENVLKDTDTNFAKWAISRISNWNETNANESIVRIHGNNDKIIPLKNHVDYLIDHGGHLMIVQRSKEISQILNDEINKSNLQYSNN